MTKTAITGGIGSGKSTVSGILRDRGLLVLDADEYFIFDPFLKPRVLHPAVPHRIFVLKVFLVIRQLS